MCRQWPTRWWLVKTLGALVAMLALSDADGAIDLELRPLESSVLVGQTVDVGLFARSASPTVTMAGAEVIVRWNPALLRLVGTHQTGAAPLLASGFLSEPYNLNDSLLDGDAMWIGLAPLGSPVMASPQGTLLTTLRFLAIAPADVTSIELPDAGGDPLGFTTVYDGVIPNLAVTGTLTSASLAIVAPSPGALALMGLALLSGGHGRRRQGEHA